jgi:hypothetical protein
LHPRVDRRRIAPRREQLFPLSSEGGMFLGDHLSTSVNTLGEVGV